MNCSFERGGGVTSTLLSPPTPSFFSFILLLLGRKRRTCFQTLISKTRFQPTVSPSSDTEITKNSERFEKKSRHSRGFLQCIIQSGEQRADALLGGSTWK